MTTDFRTTFATFFVAVVAASTYVLAAVGPASLTPFA
jgi:hypothetical protein